MRMGWVVAPPAIMEQLVVAKQASDLHSNYLSQRIAFEYLTHQDIDSPYHENPGMHTSISAM